MFGAGVSFYVNRVLTDILLVGWPRSHTKVRCTGNVSLPKTDNLYSVLNRSGRHHGLVFSPPSFFFVFLFFAFFMRSRGCLTRTANQCHMSRCLSTRGKRGFFSLGIIYSGRLAKMTFHVDEKYISIQAKTKQINRIKMNK